MKKLISLVSSISVVALLAACGGGGDDGLATATPSTTTTTPATTTTTGAAAKYVGTWVGCFPNGTNASTRETLVLTQQGPDSLSTASTETSFAAASCGGAAGTTKTSSDTAALAGTKTIGTDTVDKVIVTQKDRPPQKQVLLVKGTAPAMLFVGKGLADGGTVDAEGYPTTLDSLGFSKQ